MRTQVLFDYAPEARLARDDESDILTVAEATWLVPLLRTIERAEVEPELCQEDWGVVAFVRRDRCRFWIGLSLLDGEREWLAHVHHGSFAFLQWSSTRGSTARDALVLDLQRALRDAGAGELRWFAEKDVNLAHPAESPLTP